MDLKRAQKVKEIIQTDIKMMIFWNPGELFWFLDSQRQKIEIIQFDSRKPVIKVCQQELLYLKFMQH